MRIAKTHGRMAVGAIALVLAGSAWAIVGATDLEPPNCPLPDATEPNARPVAQAPCELAAPPIRVRDPSPTPVAAVPEMVEASAPAPSRPCKTEVSFVDAITGEVIAGCSPSAVEEPEPEDDDVRELPRPGWERVASGSGDDPALWRPKSGTSHCRVPAPYFVWDRLDAQGLSDRATSFRVVRPLHRELDVRLRLFERDGSRAPWNALRDWSLDGLSSATSILPIGNRTLRLSGVPWIPGRSFTLHFRAPAEGGSFERMNEPTIEVNGGGPLIDGEVRTITYAYPESRSFDLIVPMPASPSDPVELDVILDWSTVPSYRDEGWSSHGCCWGHAHGCGWVVREVPLGDARVRIVDSAGRPIPRVRVRIATIPAVTDADGVARVTGAREGIGHVFVQEAGYRFESRQIAIVAGQEASLEVAEAPASTLEVHVVDVDDRPLPSASVKLTTERFEWFDVDAEGVQRLDPFTDRFGVRLCNGVPCGKATVSASFAGLSGNVETVVREGVPSIVRIVLK